MDFRVAALVALLVAMTAASVSVPLGRSGSVTAAEDSPQPTPLTPLPTTARGRTLLFWDDHDVLYRSGTRRVAVQPSRRSERPLVAQSKPWEVAIGWTSIYRDPKSGRYQLWYQAYAGRRAGDKRLECVVCYAESDDGIEFRKPELDLFPFKEHARTNIVLIGNGGYGDRYCNSVLVEPHEPDAARRYKMAYYDWAVEGEREYPGLCLAFSPDGVHWTKHDKGPLYKTAYGARGVQPPLSDEDGYRETPGKDKRPRKTWFYPLTMADAVDLMYDPRRAEYVIYGKMWMDAPDGGAAWKHGLGRTASKSLFDWSPPQFILAPDDRDPLEVEFHTSPVFYHGERYVCLNQLFQRKLKGAIDIELMTSVDGLSWERNFRDQPFLARSKPGLFDSRSIFTNSTPVMLDDEMRFYYGAYNQSPLGGVKSALGERSGVGMVSLPRDRFAGLRPVARSEQPTLKKPLDHIGQVTLKPLDLTDCRRILLNAAADGPSDEAERRAEEQKSDSQNSNAQYADKRSGGERLGGERPGGGTVRVELLTETGRRVTGFTADDALPLEGDSLRHECRWQNRTLADLPPGRYLVRLHLQAATIYAISFR